MRKIQFLFVLLAGLFIANPIFAGNVARDTNRVYLDSKKLHNGNFVWKMERTDAVRDYAEKVSSAGYNDKNWAEAAVPSTVLTNLVANGVYPDPYYGINNRLSEKLIPDLYEAGREFYTYWFRTEFDLDESYAGKNIWLQVDGINYRAEIWVNGFLTSVTEGMFLQDVIDITDFAKVGAKNCLAVKVYPVDLPGTTMMRKEWGAQNEFHNGGNGDIGYNSTMLMTAGWDFTFMDGVRDRNTGIWRSISLYTTGKVDLRNPFVKSELNDPGFDVARNTASVEVYYPSKTFDTITCTVKGEIVGENIEFSKTIRILRGMNTTVTFTPEEFNQLVMKNPRLWWPKNKGEQNMYEVKFTATVDGQVSDEISTRFGIRDVKAVRNTPDSSKLFVVNGKPMYIRGTNWIPEAMLRTDDARMEAEMKYTDQCGVNFIRLWGGGIVESDYFYQLCDEYGFMVWQEFFMTGDTRHPNDQSIYFNNVTSSVKRIRNHPSIIFYVSSNESTEVYGMPELLERLDGTRPYQMQSECDGIHDGSPYKTVNFMRHYENTASDRGSRVDGFNPEYGAATLPLIESLRKMMKPEDLWPFNQKVWDYMEGEGFYYITSLHKEMADQYGKCKDIEDFAFKSQVLGAMMSKSIYEVWNQNKFNFGDRYCSGYLFWYHNCPIPQTDSRMWDWYLEPTSSLYHAMHCLEPVHVQFDYLKNTVSVINDYYTNYKGYKVVADVYDFNSKKVLTKQLTVDIPEESVLNDIIKIDFPANISQVHFINLRILDEKGKTVSENFYWRSNDKYEGKTTVTGPCVSGFQDLEKLPAANVKMKSKVQKVGDKYVATVTLTNSSSKIAFFNQLHLFSADKNPVRPCYYTDNFFSLLPGASKTVTIEADAEYVNGTPYVTLTTWN